MSTSQPLRLETPLCLLHRQDGAGPLQCRRGAHTRESRGAVRACTSQGAQAGSGRGGETFRGDWEGMSPRGASTQQWVLQEVWAILSEDLFVNDMVLSASRQIVLKRV